MKPTARTIVLAASVLALSAAAASATGPAQRQSRVDRDMKAFGTETVSKTLAFADPSKPGEVVVDNLYGPIKVEAHAGREVVLEAKKIVYARDEARAAKAEAEVRLDITAKGNHDRSLRRRPFRETEAERRSRGIHMHGDPGYLVYYGFTLKVRPGRTWSWPRSSTATSRSARRRRLRRPQRHQSRPPGRRGRLRRGRIGRGRRDRRVPAPSEGPCSFKSVSGDVEVDFPGEPSADFRIKTMNGEAYSDFAVTYLPKAPPVRQERPEEGGKYVYRSDGGYGVRTGKGGPEIKLETLTGDILIAKRGKSTS